MHSFGGLDVTQDQVSHVEGPLSHIAVVVAAQLLFVSRVSH
jgi:hypothetical protein